MWEKLGMNHERLILVRKKIVEFYEDEKLIKNINENFADGMDLYEDKYKKLIENYAQ
jgi:hypothetical protein